jgi:hypothetical protein
VAWCRVCGLRFGQHGLGDRGAKVGGKSELWLFSRGGAEGAEECEGPHAGARRARGNARASRRGAERAENCTGSHRDTEATEGFYPCPSVFIRGFLPQRRYGATGAQRKAIPSIRVHLCSSAVQNAGVASLSVHRCSKLARALPIHPYTCR